MKMSEFIQSSNLPAQLIKAVVRQSGGWRAFQGVAEDIVQHGIDGGFPGFFYTSDIEKFARKNLIAIRELASAQADEFGQSAIQMIQGFYCFRGNEPTVKEVADALYLGKQLRTESITLNALAWYAAEEVARAYVDAVEMSR